MLEINDKEVIASQVAGSFASDNNDRISIMGPAQYRIADLSGLHYYVPVTAPSNNGGTRMADIVVLLGSESQVFGCFLR